MPEVKGSVLLSCLAFVDEKYGPAHRLRLREALDESTRVLMDGKILPVNWYPFEHLIHFMKTAQNVLEPRSHSFYRDMGRFATDFAVNRFYRFLMSFASTERVIRRAEGIWQTFYRPGQMKILEVGNKKARLQLLDFPHESPEFCERLMGWMVRMVELTGGRNCQMLHPLCIARGEPYCEFYATWI